MIWEPEAITVVDAGASAPVAKVPLLSDRVWLFEGRYRCLSICGWGRILPNFSVNAISGCFCGAFQDLHVFPKEIP